MGIDTWGVDYGLLDERGRLLSDPVNYRDERTAGVMERAFAVVPEEEIYRRTGLARCRSTRSTSSIPRCSTATRA